MAESISIVPLRPEHAPQVAEIHMQAIPTGFLSSLGIGFLTKLYSAIASCSDAFGYVAVSEQRVQGFIACATSTGNLYKRVLIRHGWRFAISLVGSVLRIQQLKKIAQTLLYPAKVSEEYPDPEILSVAVRPEARSKGLGSLLMDAALVGFRERNCSEVKVVVGADNLAANNYYLKAAFHLTGTTLSHGVPTNIYTRIVPGRD